MEPRAFQFYLIWILPKFYNFIRKPIAGIVGIISLVSGPYLVVITRKAKLGALLGGQGELWKIVETEIISYARWVILSTLYVQLLTTSSNLKHGQVLVTFVKCRSEHHLTAEQLESNRRYTDMLKQVLSTPYFYFSYNFDLSHSRQRFDEQKSKEFLAR